MVELRFDRPAQGMPALWAFKLNRFRDTYAAERKTDEYLLRKNHRQLGFSWYIP